MKYDLGAMKKSKMIHNKSNMTKHLTKNQIRIQNSLNIYEEVYLQRWFAVFTKKLHHRYLIGF